MTKTIGRWILESLRIYNPYSGITNNQSEGFNTVLKRLQNWREVPVDAIVLTLYHLQAFYHNEIQRGFSGIGSYSLSAELVAAKRSPDEICTIPTYSPEDIVSRIREDLDINPPSDNQTSSSSSSSSNSDISLTTQISRARLVKVVYNYVEFRLLLTQVKR